MKYKSLILYLFFAYYAVSAMGQLPNDAFIWRDSISSSDEKSLDLNLSILGFTKNNEYFNPIADGYTLFGSQFHPEISYTVNSQFKIEGGIYLRDDWANPGVEKVVPTLTLRAKYSGIEVVMGVLDGALNHGLIEPLYDFERVLDDRIEQGLQFKLANSEKISMDIWVEWENMIYPGDVDQEEVFGGISIVKNLGKSSFSIPVQLLIYHQGGQIDLNPAPLKTMTNLALGLVRKDELSGFLTSWDNSVYFVHYKDFSFTKVQSFDKGHGWYANTMVTLRNDFKLMLSYWSGHQFIGLQGGEIYPSVTSKFKNPGYSTPSRNLLILRIMHDIQLGKGIFLTTRIEPFFDFDGSRVDFSHGFYLQYRDIYNLLKRK